MERQAQSGRAYPAYGEHGEHGEREPNPRTLSERARSVLESAVGRMLGCQRPDGHWCAELEGDSILQSEYVLTLWHLGYGEDPRVAKAVEELRRRQGPDGGWPLYPGGPADVSASVKAYLVLKLAGDEPDAPHMRRARRRILDLGGVDATNSFTKLYLAIFGQYPWEEAPAVPPELVLFPLWFPFNLYEMSAWTRAIVVPLSIIWAKKPRCEVPASAAIPELRVVGSRPRPGAGRGSGHARRWARFFLAVDRAQKRLERLRIRPLRRLALARAEAWILPRLEKSEGLGAIFPPIINTLLALDALGYDHDDPVFRGQLEELRKLEIEEHDRLRVQPCKSPVWDTALTVNALAECLPADDPRLRRAALWIVDREVREPGDWRVKNPGGPIGGWYFEYANEFYPDCDDTAQILTALSKLRFAEGAERRRVEGSMRRAVDWLLSMQNADGGWGSFDVGCDREALEHVPFADHNAMIDPSTADITARVLECSARLGIARELPAVRRAVAYLLGEQEADGSWYGRWGCNYVYGTFLALQGLAAVGEDMGADWARRAAAWLRAHQNPDGGWGELPASYDDPALKGLGPSTACQTAWALLGLFAVGDYDSRAVRRGVEFLAGRQRDDGGWVDEAWTGTGFPRVFYLAYHDYANYFPIQALGVYLGRGAGSVRVEPLRLAARPTEA